MSDITYLILLLSLLLLGVTLWSLPLYLCVNLVLWLFGSTIRITLLQAFGLCLLTVVIKGLFSNKEDK